MRVTRDFFSGIQGLEYEFDESYRDCISEEIIDRIFVECCQETLIYELNEKFHPTPDEYIFARHLTDQNLLDLVNLIFVKNYRDYKYCRGRPDTADHSVHILAQKGIYISASTYNNWKRSKCYRLIDNESLNLLLDLLHLTPNDYKCIVYAHIAAQRKVSRDKDSDGIFHISQRPNYDNNFSGNDQSARPPSAAA